MKPTALTVALLGIFLTLHRRYRDRRDYRRSWNFLDKAIHQAAELPYL